MTVCPANRAGVHDFFMTQGGHEMCQLCGLKVLLAGDRDGKTFDRSKDLKRLNKQHLRVYWALEDGEWFTLATLSALTGDPEASVSARLRDFRKERFGGHEVMRRRVSDGLWEYQLLWNEDVPRPGNS